MRFGTGCRASPARSSAVCTASPSDDRNTRQRDLPRIVYRLALFALSGGLHHRGIPPSAKTVLRAVGCGVPTPHRRAFAFAGLHTAVSSLPRLSKVSLLGHEQISTRRGGGLSNWRTACARRFSRPDRDAVPVSTPAHLLPPYRTPPGADSQRDISIPRFGHCVKRYLLPSVISKATSLWRFQRFPETPIPIKDEPWRTSSRT
jgi:hypothetical protein